MNAQWPATLPQKPLANGFQEVLPNQVIGTQMDAGPKKLRRRFTAAVRPFAMTIKVRSALVETFDSFFVTDCAAGSLPFDWVHPRTGAASTYQFVAGQVPQYAPAGGDWWLITMTLELLP